MANVTKIVFHDEAIRALMRSPEVTEELEARAQKIVEHANDVGSGKYAYEVSQSKTRSSVKISPVDKMSRNSNAKHNTLLKSIDAGR